MAALGPWGPLVFIAVYAVAAVALLPAAVLTMMAGAIFGVLRGSAFTLVGATIGAVAAFLISRYAARDAVARRLARRPTFAAIDRAIGDEGRKIVFLLRLSPAFPFVVLNYVLGLTRVRFVDYLVASVGMIPGTLLYAYYGKLIGDAAALAGGRRIERGPADWVLLFFGLAATFAATAIITRAARRAVRARTANLAPAPEEGAQ